MKVFQVSPKGKATLEASAKETLEDFNLHLLKKAQPLDVERLVEFYMPEVFGWHLDPQSSLPSSIEGYCDPKDQTIVVADETLLALSSGGRPMFTLTHEFAHVKEHRAQMQSRMVEYDEKSERLYRSDRSEIVPFRDPEWQANYLAGALLMPEKHIVPLLHRERGPSIRLAKEIEKLFNVSYQAATVRMNYVWGNHFEQKKGY